jgi:hypothetical protein
MKMAMIELGWKSELRDVKIRGHGRASPREKRAEVHCPNGRQSEGESGNSDGRLARDLPRRGDDRARFPRIFVSHRNGDSLLTANLSPGKKVYAERLLSVNSPEGATKFRVWNPQSSKTAPRLPLGRGYS